MYKKILLKNKHSLKVRIKKLIAYYLAVRGARLVWKHGFGLVFKHHPEYNRPAERSLEEAHQLYWAPLRRKVNLATLRNSYNVSGIANPKCIPEEIFEADFEPTLNPTCSVEYISNKSLYNHWFPDNLFPKDYLHNIDGDWYDHDLNSISFEDVKTIAGDLNYPVVMKPNRDSYGGRDVFFPERSRELLELVDGKKDFLVQEKLVQHSFLQKLNPHGINSLRVNIYRSVKDNQLHVVTAALRMGVGGSLDNLSSGGISVLIRKDGVMDGYAQDTYSKKLYKHPDTGLGFDHRIPDFEQAKRVALQVARNIFYARVICLDLGYDSEGRWRMIEVNLNGTTLMFAQNHGVPFFDEFSDEVRNYVIENHWAL